MAIITCCQKATPTRTDLVPKIWQKWRCNISNILVECVNWSVGEEESHSSRKRSDAHVTSGRDGFVRFPANYSVKRWPENQMLSWSIATFIIQQSLPFLFDYWSTFYSLLGKQTRWVRLGWVGRSVHRRCHMCISKLTKASRIKIIYSQIR